MARVKFGSETFDVDDALLEDFFANVLIDREDMAEYLGSLKSESRLVLQDYIAYRLAEVDPGYVPSPE